MNAVKNRGSKYILLSTLASLTLAIGAGASFAAGPEGMTLPSITVKYNPTEVATPKGAAELYRRIKFAAARVCERYTNQELVRRTPWNKCYSETLANAVAAVHQPVLTALHNRTTSEPRG